MKAFVPPNLRILDEQAEEVQREREAEFRWGPSRFDEQVSDMARALDYAAQAIAERMEDGIRSSAPNYPLQDEEWDAIEVEILSVV